MPLTPEEAGALIAAFRSLVADYTVLQPVAESCLPTLEIVRSGGEWSLVGRGHMRNGAGASYHTGTKNECVYEAMRRFPKWPVKMGED